MIVKNVDIRIYSSLRNGAQVYCRFSEYFDQKAQPCRVARIARFRGDFKITVYLDEDKRLREMRCAVRFAPRYVDRVYVTRETTFVHRRQISIDIFYLLYADSIDLVEALCDTQDTDHII